MATASLQEAVCEALVLDVAAQLQEEYYYDSDDSVLDIDEEYPDLVQKVGQWQAT